VWLTLTNIGKPRVRRHHEEQTDKLPDTIVVNPHQTGCSYPNKDLAGCGVAFKLACALDGSLEYSDEFEEFLNIVALGSIADVVPLLGENRIIAKLGCDTMGITNNKGLYHLIKKCGIDNAKISAGQVGFSIAPNINAIGRVGKADLGVELLMAETDEDAERLADELIYYNKVRQETENLMIEQAIETIENDEGLKNGKILILAKRDWHSGIVGIAASKICEKYNKPTILLTINSKNVCVGSARSIPAFNIFDALSTCDDLMLKWGGHPVAAGMSIGLNNLGEFIRRMRLQADSLTDEDLLKITKIDLMVKDSDITLELADTISMLEPFGVGNPTAVVGVENQTVFSKQLIGKLKNHSKFKTPHFDVLCFNDTLDDLMDGDEIHIAGNIQVNEFRGNKSVQLLMRDWKVKNG
jgi:single-stranded-DNA-specific exonuclease